MKSKKKITSELLVKLKNIIPFIVLGVFLLVMAMNVQVEKKVEPPNNESGVMGRYQNEEWALDFPFPEEWGSLNVDRYDSDSIHFTPSNVHIAQVAIHIPSRTILFIERQETDNIGEHSHERGNTVLKLEKDGTILHIYTVPQEYISFGGEGKLSYVDFSSTGRYAAIRLITSIETSVTKVFDLDTGKDLFGGQCYDRSAKIFVVCPGAVGPHGDRNYYTVESLIHDNYFWFENDAIFVIESVGDEAGFTVGIGGVIISAYSDPASLNVVVARDQLSDPLPPQGVIPLDPSEPGRGFVTYFQPSEIMYHSDGTITFRTEILVYTSEENQLIEIREFKYQVKNETLEQLNYHQVTDTQMLIDNYQSK